MSAPVMAVDAAGLLQRALIAALTADLDVQAVFGTPARVLDEVGEYPAFPFATIERHEVRPADSAEVAASEHVLTFAIGSRWGGRSEAVDALQALRAGLERADPEIAGHAVVLGYPTYGDVFQARDGRTFRGILRARFILERIS